MDSHGFINGGEVPGLLTDIFSLAVFVFSIILICWGTKTIVVKVYRFVTASYYWLTREERDVYIDSMLRDEDGVSGTGKKPSRARRGPNHLGRDQLVRELVLILKERHGSPSPTSANFKMLRCEVRELLEDRGVHEGQRLAIITRAVALATIPSNDEIEQQRLLASSSALERGYWRSQF